VVSRSEYVKLRRWFIEASLLYSSPDKTVGNQRNLRKK